MTELDKDNYFYNNMEKLFNQETLVSFFSCADYAISLEDFVENIINDKSKKSIEEIKIKEIFDFFRKEEIVGGAPSISGFKSYIKKKIYLLKIVNNST